MGFPVYVCNLPNTTAQEEKQIITKLKQYGEIWNDSIEYYRRKSCFTIKVVYKQEKYARRAAEQFPIAKYKNAKIYDKQVCWACQQKNSNKPHLRKCINNPLNQSKFSDKPNQPQQKTPYKGNRNCIVTQTLNLKIGVNSIKNIYAEEKTPEKNNSLVFINKKNQRINVKIEEDIKLEEMCFIGDQYGTVKEINNPQRQVNPNKKHKNYHEQEHERKAKVSDCKGQSANKKQAEAINAHRRYNGQKKQGNNPQKKCKIGLIDSSPIEQSQQSLQIYRKKKKPKNAFSSETKFKGLSGPAQLSHSQIPTKQQFEKLMNGPEETSSSIMENFQEYLNEDSAPGSDGLQELMNKLNSSTFVKPS